MALKKKKKDRKIHKEFEKVPYIIALPFKVAILKMRHIWHMLIYRQEIDNDIDEIF